MQFVQLKYALFNVRTTLTLFGFLLLSISVIGQKKVADFSILDSEGNSHSLYSDYLDQDKIVVIDLFFTECPPCNTMAPFIKSSYEKWGGGKEMVQFLSLSPIDNDQKINSFQEVHQLEHPASGIEGDGDIALKQFTNDFFGPFFGYPVLILVRPNGEVIFDVHSSKGDKETIDLLNFHIENELKGEEKAYDIIVFPNPSVDPGLLNIKVPDDASFELDIFDIQGQRILHDDLFINESGIYNFEHLIADYNTGMYFIIINVKGELLVSRKFIIL